MHLRHIEPGSVDWMEAMDYGEGEERLSPEEAARLRHMLAVEQATLGMPPIDLDLPPIQARARASQRL